MRTLLTALLLTTLAGSAHAQLTDGTLSFALPEHPGRLSLKQGAYTIKELSAKDNGREFGIRAESGDIELLGFLFVFPEQPHMTSATCREEMMRGGDQKKAPPYQRVDLKSGDGTGIAIAIGGDKGRSPYVRAFVASGDLCGDILFSHPHSTDALPLDAVKYILQTLHFDPAAKPTFREAFAYATVDFDHQELNGAILGYRAALKLVDTSDDPLKWRRVTTDQLSMSLGMSGDLKASRAVDEAAIAKDPTYPLYYYNLACADAEAGDAIAARTHLQQAYDRRANTLQGEPFPDPSTDDSFLKLKSDKKFWEFVQTLRPKAKS